MPSTLPSRRPLRTALVAAGCAGAALLTAGGTAIAHAADTAAPAASRPTTAAATTAAAAAAAASVKTPSPFSGTRQLYITPTNSEAGLTVTRSGQVGLSDAFGKRALFVLTKVRGDQYSIRTATLRVGGEPSCVSAVLGRHARPGQVTTTACDTGDARQLFRFRHSGAVDGKPTYTIRTTATTYVVQDPDGALTPGGTGVVAAHIGEGTPDIDTSFLLVDRGRAHLPGLG